MNESKQHQGNESARKPDSQPEAPGSAQSSENAESSESGGVVGTITPDFEGVQVDLRHAIIAGVLTTLVTLIGAWLVGLASGVNTEVLLEFTLPNARSFAGTIVLALSTVLALMLTILSLSSGEEVDLEATHYRRIKQISWYDSVTLIAAVLIYLLLNFPLGESEAPDATTVTIIYYVTLISSSLLGGALCAIVLMLFNTVQDIIRIVAPEQID